MLDADVVLSRTSRSHPIHLQYYRHPTHPPHHNHPPPPHNHPLPHHPPPYHHLPPHHYHHLLPPPPHHHHIIMQVNEAGKSSCTFKECADAPTADIVRAFAQSNKVFENDDVDKVFNDEEVGDDGVDDNDIVRAFAQSNL